MIVVTVALKSAIHPSRDKELARMEIANIGGTDTKGDYSVRTLRGRSQEDLDKRVVNRDGVVIGYPRLAIHVWHLVHDALKALHYNKHPGKKDRDE